MRGGIGELLVGLVDGVPVMHEHRHQRSWVYLQVMPRDVLVGASLDEIDVVALVRHAEFGEAHAGLLRAEREMCGRAQERYDSTFSHAPRTSISNEVADIL